MPHPPARRAWPAIATRLLAATAAAATATAAADEGMWTFDHPPTELVRQRYGIELTPQLLQHIQHAAVDVDASASFVSRDGLLLTNHHVAASCIHKLSGPGRDLMANGYLARDRGAELRCPGGTARVLMAIDDVSTTVHDAAAAAGTDEQKNAARKAVIADLEARCRKASGLQCEMVALHSGSVYQLYRFKEWDDVRLVFAPEAQAANFGGDDDNFVYPRFALDFALLRVYEEGQPVSTEQQHLKLAARPAAEGDAVLVAGHPHRTFRLRTLAQLQALRDSSLPLQEATALAQQALLHAYAKHSPEAARQAQDMLLGTENWLKSTRGALAALRTPAVMERKAAEEAAFRAAYARQGLPGDPWAQIEAAVQRSVARANESWAIGYGYRGLFEHAGRLVEMAHERALPEAQRLREYRDAELPALERRIKADVPVYKELEAQRLASQFEQARQLLGDAHPYVRAVLAGPAPDSPPLSPQAAAERLVRDTRLHDHRERSTLLAGGTAALQASTDPLVRLARAVYPQRRALARFEEEEVDTPIEQAAAALGRARFAIHGRSLPPDATGTLRLSYGRVAGYLSHGIRMPWKTTLGGLLDRADSFDARSPFDLPPQLERARARIDPRVPLNFVTTADISGGNSGSPVLNAQGEWLGVVFDGNLPSLGWRFVYTDAEARSVVVDARAILHTLERIYGATALAHELRGTAPAHVAPARPRRRR